MNNRVQKSPERKPAQPLPEYFSEKPGVIFTDVDDTLTYGGQIPVDTFVALEALRAAGFTVVPVTGASAGWCDCLIKTWPINHIIGENGALCMIKNEQGIVSVQYSKDASTNASDFNQLQQLANELTNTFPTIKYTQDQPFRVTDIAFDIGQTVDVEEATVIQALSWLNSKSIHARRSSIHINAWIGDHSKSTGATHWLKQRDIHKDSCIFIGDSPNDESMFEHFPLSVGVSNIGRFLPEMTYLPTYLTEQPGGYGFVNLANVLLDNNDT